MWSLFQHMNLGAAPGPTEILLWWWVCLQEESNQFLIVFQVDAIIRPTMHAPFDDPIK